jgi:hypothetical protein
MDTGFSKNVFINCPYDKEYESLLRPLVFTVRYLGFTPRLALESSDSGETRIEKICRLIRESVYSIHDISRLESTKASELYRLNMAFELGMDFGCRRYSADQHHAGKKYLIFEKEHYRYMKALSDISGFDIKFHENEGPKIVRGVRNWFVENAGVSNPDSGTQIWYYFNDFMYDFYIKMEENGYSKDDIDSMPISEYLSFIDEWFEDRNTEIA